MSILNSIKQLLGIEQDVTAFDEELKIHINTALSILMQLGVNEDQFMITGPEETWEDILPRGANLELVKSYVYLKVRMIFDPPASSITSGSFEKNIAELEWRILAETDFN